MELVQPLVSVIVPAFNHERFVEKAITSIIDQSYRNIELIVIDDGSSDNTPSILAKLSEKYGFKYISRPNKGLAATLNEGVGHAHGKYVSLLASDDYWEPEKIASQVRVMEQDENVRLCFAAGFGVDEHGNVTVRMKYGEGNKEVYTFDDIILSQDMPTASIMLRMADIVRIGGFDESLKVEDLYVWLKILENGGVAHVISLPLVYHRSHPHNTHKDAVMITEEHFKTIGKFRNSVHNFGAVEAEWAVRNFTLLARHHKTASLHYLPKALRKYTDVRLYKGLTKLFFVWWR